MKVQKVRNMLAVALFAVMMMAGNAQPAAAAPALREAPPLGCTLSGTFYPVGTLLRFELPYPPSTLYMRCEMGRSPGPGGLDPRWFYYNSPPP